MQLSVPDAGAASCHDLHHLDVVADQGADLPVVDLHGVGEAIVDAQFRDAELERKVGGVLPGHQLRRVEGHPADGLGMLHRRPPGASGVAGVLVDLQTAAAAAQRPDVAGLGGLHGDAALLRDGEGVGDLGRGAAVGVRPRDRLQVRQAQRQLQLVRAHPAQLGVDR